MKIEVQSFKGEQKFIITVSIILMFVLAFAVFMFPGFDTILGPILTALMLFIAFSGYSEMVIALIVVANDALGTMFAGSLSFSYLLIIIVLLKLLLQHSFKIDGFMVMSLILVVESFVVGDVGARQVLYSVLFVLALNMIDEEKNGSKLFYQGVALSVFIIALHACLTGGVEFVDVDKMEYARKGILGVGLGDPNFSAYLLIIGLISTWFESSFNKVLKIVFSAVMLYALTVTASISGMVALVLIVIGTLYVNNKNKLKFLIIVAIVIAMVFTALYIYNGLPQEKRTEPLDTYVERIVEKIYLFQSGDFNRATTGRVNHLSFYLDYIVNQNVFSFLFGGNTLFVSGRLGHNTVIGIILQIGFVGFFVFMLMIITKSFKMLSLVENNIHARRTVVLILLAFVMSFSLSFYQGSLWALYMYFLLHKENVVEGN